MIQHQSGPAAARPAQSRRIWLMLIVAAVFGGVLVSPYLGLDSADSRLDVRGGPHYYLLVAHIFTALVALVLGPLKARAAGRGGDPQAPLRPPGAAVLAEEFRAVSPE
ncbi:hypothetical protein ABZ897_24245 [Nonomuraea sp. NPDC046802]|uniref:hypothetical protein n=1 Tax=Nonomuraea sp. NPDC046802 TaxID=3154919 RepID=UPI00340AAB3F